MKRGSGQQVIFKITAVSAKYLDIAWFFMCSNILNNCKSLNGRNGNCFCFVFAESGGNTSSRELQRLKKRNVQLEEENNLLKLKIEILLDMVRTEQL